MANNPIRDIMTVSQLNRASNQLLGDHFFNVLVEGEVSNFSAPSSGHWYFSLKDANAQVRCAMFKNQQRRQTVKPENGKHLIVKAQVSLYEPRGDFQLIIESLEDAGEGVLRKKFDALLAQLGAEGLFDAIHKKPLPTLPDCIGIITSPSGAALRDMLTVLKRRFPTIPVILYPVPVQGEQAKYAITQAIAAANTDGYCDVLILGRGGGALEDLWAFNEEMVARAIFKSHIPVISAVGHETDFTIADYVADVRAATPSVAAEYASPDQQEWLLRFAVLETRLQQLIRRKLNQQQQTLDWLNTRFQQQHPGQRLLRNRQRLHELDTRLINAIEAKLHRQNSLLETKAAKLWQYNPAIKLNAYKQRQTHLSQRLHQTIAHKLEMMRQKLAYAGQTLHAISPLATLQRGYALATITQTGQIVRSAGQVELGDSLTVRLGRGSVESVVKHLVTED